MAEHTHVCVFEPHVGPASGCRCACGAVRDGEDWVKAVNPCAVILEEDHPLEYRVVATGGRGGRDNGVVWSGRDKEALQRLSDGLVNEHWIEERVMAGPWRRSDV